MGYRQISLNDKDYDELMAIGHKMLDPIGVTVSSAGAVRLLIRNYGVINEERAAKLKETYIDPATEEPLPDRHVE